MLKDREFFFDKIIFYLEDAIRFKNLDINRIKKIIANNNYPLYVQFQKHLEQFYRQSNKTIFFKKIYIKIASYLKQKLQEGQLEINQFSNSNFIFNFFEDLFGLFILQKLCAECYSKKISTSRYGFNENKVIYYCSDCQKNVKIIHNTNLLPLFLLYIYQWTNSEEIIAKSFSIKTTEKDFSCDLFRSLLIDSFNYFREYGNLDFILLYINLLEMVGIKFNSLEEDSKNINDLILTEIIKSLRSGEYSKIKFTLKHLIKKENDPNIRNIIKHPKFRKKIEKNFYIGLSKNLEAHQYQKFENLITNSYKLDLFINVEKIPHRFRILESSIIECIQNVSMGYQTSHLGEIISMIKFYNKFNLLEKDLDEKELEELDKIKKDSLFLSNLKDLFGWISDSLLIYIKRDLPRILYNFFIEGRKTLFYSDLDELLYYIKNQFFNNYTIYGLSVRKLGSSLEFIKEFKKNYYGKHNNIKFISSEESFFEFSTEYKFPISFYGGYYEEKEQIELKKHLVSPQNILKNINKILSKEQYSFLNLSMVLLGGIGPQGHGFTYSTPKGEVVEICSDRKENQAIIIKFKEFIKNQFIKKLRQELFELDISSIFIDKILNYLNNSMTKKELINYTKKDKIVKKIQIFLNALFSQNIDKTSQKVILKNISRSLDFILRPILMEDQFKTRMHLISKGKIEAGDVAKLTSLKGKSHYDVLRERFFYQYVINWFYKLYSKNKNSI